MSSSIFITLQGIILILVGNYLHWDLPTELSSTLCKVRFLCRRKVCQYMLNMELDLQSLFGLLRTLFSLAETSQLPPPQAFGLKYEVAIGQPR
jgi:hypothetical protein